MTELNGSHYCLKPVRDEASSSGSIEAEVKGMRSRIEDEEISLPLIERSEMLEVEAGQPLRSVEAVADNTRINREDRSELYADCTDPVWADCPRPHH